MTTINGKAIRAVIAANLALRGGFFPLLFTTLLWGGAVWYSPGVPGLYTISSIWFLGMIGVWEGLGFRLCCAAPRSWLVPGFREHYRLVRFIAIPAVSCAVAAGSANPGKFPALLAILWLCALWGFYVAGLRRHILATLFVALLLGGAIGVTLGAIESGSRLRHYREIFHLDPRWAVLLLLDVALTIWMWRRIGTQRDLTWIRPGTGAFSSWLAARRGKEVPGSQKPSPLSPASVLNATRFLSFTQTTFPASANGWRWYLSSILFWSCFVALFTRHADWSGPAFRWALALPLLVGSSLSASPRMFMLPLRRSEVIRRLATGRLFAQLREWITVAVPLTVAALLKGAALPTVCLALGATLAAQLPIFGLMLWAGSMKTASGIRYTVFMGFVLLFAANFLPLGWTDPRVVADTLLISLALGPILIWLAYRRWLNTEVGAWANAPVKS